MFELYFYKAEYGSWVDKLIAWWTDSKYSHVELHVGNGQFFSSSPREGEVRYKYIDIKQEHWDIVLLPVDTKVDLIRMEGLIGKKYDWLGIFMHQFLPLNTQWSFKWWCSEAIGYVLGLDNFRINPQELYEIYSEV